MGQRKPRANWQTTQEKNANLSDIALAIVNGLTAAIATFPTPPIPPAALQAQLNTYNTALAASIGGSKQQRKTMQAARKLLQANIILDGQYVNQIVWFNISEGQTYTDAATDITSSGFPLSTPPSPIGPLTPPTIKKWGSPKIGQLSILIRPKLKGAKAFQVQYIEHGMDITTGTIATFPNGNILLQGLPSATNIDFHVAGIGTNPARNYTAIKSQVII